MEIDEAFLPFNEMMQKMLEIDGELFTQEKDIHSYVYEFEVNSPIELDIIVDETGKVKLGIVPPLYRVETSFRPSYHSITFKADKFEK
ncbi:MAG: hypothetical protein IPL84_09610 [Chitinophagaceae bacterium]|nr:hypothetical protein [Chitinophagaceae bacterium]